MIYLLYLKVIKKYGVKHKYGEKSLIKCGTKNLGEIPFSSLYDLLNYIDEFMECLSKENKVSNKVFYYFQILGKDKKPVPLSVLSATSFFDESTNNYGKENLDDKTRMPKHYKHYSLENSILQGVEKEYDIRLKYKHHHSIDFQRCGNKYKKNQSWKDKRIKKQYMKNIYQNQVPGYLN